MFTNIHPSYVFEKKKANQRRVIAVAILLTILAVIALAVAADRLSAGATLTPVASASVVRPLDEVGFGSARTLLIASIGPKVEVVASKPIESCSPFGALTACASNHFAALMVVNRAPI